MTLEKRSKRGTVIIGIIMLALFAGSKTYASPLYGGYNGESESWWEISVVDEATVGFSLSISVGTDNENTWTRIGVSSLFLLPYIYKLEFSYETGGISSVGLTPLLLLPVKVGIDSNGLWWRIRNLLTRVEGEASDGTFWKEEIGKEGELPGVYYDGEDNNGNKWRWIKYFGVLVGQREVAPVSSAGILNQGNFLSPEKGLVSLRNRLTETYGSKLCTLLFEKLTDDAVMEGVRDQLEAFNTRRSLLLTLLPVYGNGEKFSSPVAPISKMSSEFVPLLRYIEEKIFTEEIRDEMKAFSDAFERDIQP
ncbi:MAG: hypothetical protein V3R78_04355 [Thermodesulfobacteriota bacterium]